jgi:hypothetical protein
MSHALDRVLHICYGPVRFRAKGDCRRLNLHHDMRIVYVRNRQLAIVGIEGSEQVCASRFFDLIDALMVNVKSLRQYYQLSVVPDEHIDSS